MLCREGLRSTLVDLGAPLGEGKSGFKVGALNAKVAHKVRVRETPTLSLRASLRTSVTAGHVMVSHPADEE